MFFLLFWRFLITFGVPRGVVGLIGDPPGIGILSTFWIKHKFLNPSDLKTVITLEDLCIYWGAKEALYKYYGKKEVLFIEHLFIENFDKNSSTFKGIINMPEFKKEINMNFEILEDHTLVYTM